VLSKRSAREEGLEPTTDRFEICYSTN